MTANTSTRYNRFLLLGNTAVKEPAPLAAEAKALAFFQCIGKKYRCQRSGENVSLYFLHSRSDSLALSLEYSLYFWGQMQTKWGQTRGPAPTEMEIKMGMGFHIPGPLIDAIALRRGEPPCSPISSAFSSTFLFHKIQNVNGSTSISNIARSIDRFVTLYSRAQFFEKKSEIRKHEIRALREINPPGPGLLKQIIHMNRLWLGLINQSIIINRWGLANQTINKNRLRWDLNFQTPAVINHVGTGDGSGGIDIFNTFPNHRQLITRLSVLSGVIPMLYRSIEPSLMHQAPPIQPLLRQWFTRLLNRSIDRFFTLSSRAQFFEKKSEIRKHEIRALQEINPPGPGLLKQIFHMNRLWLDLINPALIINWWDLTNQTPTFINQFRALTQQYSPLINQIQISPKGDPLFHGSPGETILLRDHLTHRLPGAGAGSSRGDIFNIFANDRHYRRLITRLSVISRAIQILNAPLHRSIAVTAFNTANSINSISSVNFNWRQTNRFDGQTQWWLRQTQWGQTRGPAPTGMEMGMGFNTPGPLINTIDLRRGEPPCSPVLSAFSSAYLLHKIQHINWSTLSPIINRWLHRSVALTAFNSVNSINSVNFNWRQAQWTQWGQTRGPAPTGMEMEMGFNTPGPLINTIDLRRGEPLCSPVLSAFSSAFLLHKIQHINWSTLSPIINRWFHRSVALTAFNSVNSINSVNFNWRQTNRFDGRQAEWRQRQTRTQYGQTHRSAPTGMGMEMGFNTPGPLINTIDLRRGEPPCSPDLINTIQSRRGAPMCAPVSSALSSAFLLHKIQHVNWSTLSPIINRWFHRSIAITAFNTVNSINPVNSVNFNWRQRQTQWGQTRAQYGQTRGPAPTGMGMEMEMETGFNIPGPLINAIPSRRGAPMCAPVSFALSSASRLHKIQNVNWSTLSPIINRWFHRSIAIMAFNTFNSVNFNWRQTNRFDGRQAQWTQWGQTRGPAPTGMEMGMETGFNIPGPLINTIDLRRGEPPCSPDLINTIQLRRGAPMCAPELFAFLPSLPSLLLSSLSSSLSSSSSQSFMHNNTFIAYLHKKNRENPDINRPGKGAADEPPIEKPAHEKTVDDIIRAREPEAPGFEKERLLLRHTFAFSLARLARRQEEQADQAAKAEKNVSILLPGEKWLGSKIAVTKEKELSPIEEFWQMRKEKSSYAIVPGSRILDLKTLAGGDYRPSSYPVMMHGPNREAAVTREKIMQIEQTVTAQTKQLEKKLNDALRASASPGKIAVDGLLINQQEIKLSLLADGVYNMLLDRIKKERSMRGY